MGVQRRMNWLGQERVEVSHLRLMESSEAADFDALGYAMVKDQPYVVRGLTLNANGIGGQADALLLTIANSQFINWRASESGSLFLLPIDAAAETLNGGNTRVIGGFTPGATNYVSLDVVSIADPNSIDTVRFKDAGDGTEFTGDVPVTRVTDWRIYVGTIPFTQATGRVAVAQVVTDANNNVVSITDSRSLLFRMYAARRVPAENPSTSTDPGVDPFIGGDKNLTSLREWMEVVMTRLQDLGGSTNWYEYTQFQPASPTALGLVQLYTAAVNPLIPVVPVVDADGFVTAEGIARDIITLKSTLAGNSTSTGVIIDTTNTRTLGALFRIRNQGANVLTVDSTSGLTLLGRLSASPASGDLAGVVGTGSGDGSGVVGVASGSEAGVAGQNLAVGGIGVYGMGDTTGVIGEGGSIGVRGITVGGVGVGIQGESATGVRGIGTGPGVQAETDGSAGRGALNIVPQGAPATPSLGDMWIETGATGVLRVRANDTPATHSVVTDLTFTNDTSNTVAAANWTVAAASLKRLGKSVSNGYGVTVFNITVQAGAAAGTVACTLPAGFRPSTQYWSAGWDETASVMVMYFIDVLGRVTFARAADIVNGHTYQLGGLVIASGNI